MIEKYNIGDMINGKKVINVTKNFVCFIDQKISKKRLDSGDFEIKYRLSPNVSVDWSDINDVKKYYDSFDFFSTYISNGDSRDKKTIQIEVKDNLIFYNGQYHIPAPTPKWYENNLHRWNAKHDHIEDGFYNVDIYYKYNDWYGSNLDKNSIELKLFVVKSRINSISSLTQNNDEIYARIYDSAITVDYSASYVNGLSIWFKDIDMIRFFKEYYINLRWESGVRVVLTDAEILKTVDPLKDRIKKILKDAIDSKKYEADYDESYGEFSFNYIKLDDSVCNSIFNKINNRLKHFKI